MQAERRGDRKSKRMAQYLLYPTIPQLPCHGLVWPARWYLGTWVIWGRYNTVPFGGGPHLPIIVGPWGTLGLARLAGLGELTLVNLAVSPCGLGVICT